MPSSHAIEPAIMIEKREQNPPDRRASRPGWIGFAALCALVIVAAVALIASFGLPGTTGGTSESQQQTSGAPQPTIDIQDGETRQNTTGYGNKSNQ